MPTPVAELKTSLEGHNDVFESLLKLIPPKYYLVNDFTDEQIASKYQKHSKNQKASKQAIKEASKKARRNKLDPANHKSIIDIQQEEAEAKDAEDSAVSDDEDGHDTMDVDDASPTAGNSESQNPVPMPASGGIAELRQKLHARMSVLRRRSGREWDGEAGDKDELLEERRRQRAAMREKRRKETKERIRREEEASHKKSKQDVRDSGRQTKTQLLVPDVSSSNRPIPNGQTTVSFSKLANAGPTRKAALLKTSSNPSQALEQLAARKEKLAALAPEKRKAVEEREKWDKAEARMDGVKVRDDESRLKQVVKKKDKQKLKSKKAWDDRKERITNDMAAKQKKRTDNIAMRNERRNDKRKGHGKTKARPGFEGKTFGKGKAAAKPSKR